MTNRIFFRACFGIAVLFGVAVGAHSQFPIKIPSMPKVEKPKTGNLDNQTATPGSTPGPTSTSGRGGRIYENDTPTEKLVVIQPRVFIQAVNNNSYWKMPNVSSVTSWIPEVKIDLFTSDRSEPKMVAEYYNPDGSLWFTEAMQTSDDVVRSNETWTLINSKSTNAIGTYSVKVKNKETVAVVFAGKFKVNKFPMSERPTEKNKLGFYVDHDWLVPLGMVHVPTSQDLTKGWQNPVFSVWTKGDVKYEELEVYLYNNGKLVASKKVSSGSANDERMSQFTAAYDSGNIYKRWDVQFHTVLLQNGTPYVNGDGDEYFVDANPGQYVFKLYRNGTQIREFAVTVGTDGRFVRPPYSDAFTFPQHGILLPAKVTGNMEKWNPIAWKTDMFYGNTLSGFAVP